MRRPKAADGAHGGRQLESSEEAGYFWRPANYRFADPIPGKYGGRIIGTARGKYNRTAVPKGDSRVCELLERAFPGLSSKFHYADYSIDSVEQSIAEYHSDKYPGATVPRENRKVATEAVCSAYKRGGLKWTFGIRPGMPEESLKQLFEETYPGIVGSISRKSTPGYPYRLFADNNGDLLDHYGEEVKEQVWNRLKGIYYWQGDFAELRKDPTRWISEGLRDPVRLFPKNQALPRRKSMPRCISQISVVDQMIERLFFQGYTDAEGNCFPNLPTQKGIGFTAELAQQVGDKVYGISQVLESDPIASDVSGWEKNFDLELAENHATVMASTAEDYDECKEIFDKAANWWCESMFSTPYIMDDGRLITFDDLKVQRSGDFLTTSSNSSGRSYMAEGVGSEAVTMGDDCLEWSEDPGKLPELYSALNLPVRDVERHKPGDFIFCSHRFQRQGDGSWRCWLETWERMIFESSRSKLNDPSTTANYLSEIAMMPDGDTKDRLVGYLAGRSRLLGAVAGHEWQEESHQDPDPGL